VEYGLADRRLPAGYSIETESRALGAAIEEAFGAAPIDLAAWSYGAFATLDYALDHQERVRTVTLIEPPALWVLDAAGTGDARSTREAEEMRALYEQMADDVTEAQLAGFLRLAGLVPPGETPTDLPQWPVFVQHRRSLRTGAAEWAHTDTVARLRSFDRPALLVKGAGSSHFLHRIVDGLAVSMPRARVIELPGGHAPQLVAADAFLEQMAAFQLAPAT
jgi:pimeloyl-ACP methyl ester carboxylesterase